MMKFSWMEVILVEAPGTAISSTPAASPTWKDLSAYLLRIGATSFGGTVVIAERIRRDLVEERRWISHEEYMHGFAFAQLAPGPLVPQLVMYLGYLRHGILGATLAALSFVGPSFLVVVLLASAYVRSNGLAWIQALFYGISAAVVAIIAQAAYKLGRAAIGKDWLYSIILVIVAALTALTRQQVIWMFLGGGLISVLIKAPPKLGAARSICSIGALPALGIGAGKSIELLLFFAKAGLFVFGSGFAIVPLLHSGVVQEHCWLSERQFIDAVALGMITPGPMVVVAAFIGFLVAGFPGAIAGTVGVFLPIYLFVIIFAPHYKAITGNLQARAFLKGVTAAAAGALAGTVYVLGIKSIHDISTALIAAATMTALLLRKSLPQPLLITASGIAGLLLYRYH
jgi:chromate transporter